VPAGEISWKATLTDPQTGMTVSFGMDRRAGSGYDFGIDLGSSPLYRDLRIEHNGHFYQNDLRGFSKRTSWTVNVDGVSAEALEWKAQHREGHHAFVLEYLDKDLSPELARMPLSEAGAIPVPDTGRVRLRITYLAEQTKTISLKRGWNFVGVPFQPTSNSASDLFTDAEGKPVFRGNPWKLDGRRWRKVTDVEPLMGYRLFAPKPAKIEVSGHSLLEPRLSINKGWNVFVWAEEGGALPRDSFRLLREAGSWGRGRREPSDAGNVYLGWSPSEHNLILDQSSNASD
jgi:hypothetical protein